jgi:hypothetical protein
VILHRFCQERAAPKGTRVDQARKGLAGSATMTPHRAGHDPANDEDSLEELRPDGLVLRRSDPHLILAAIGGPGSAECALAGHKALDALDPGVGVDQFDEVAV